MSKATAQEIVNNMMRRDAFSQWLGIRILKTEAGFCQLEMTVRDEMLNGFGIGHGGIVFAMADSALAFSANSHGRVAVALNNSINYTKPVQSGDVLRGTCNERTLTENTGTYDVQIKNQDEEIVGLFRGTVYRKKDVHQS